MTHITRHEPLQRQKSTKTIAQSVTVTKAKDEVRNVSFQLLSNLKENRENIRYNSIVTITASEIDEFHYGSLCRTEQAISKSLREQHLLLKRTDPISNFKTICFHAAYVKPYVIDFWGMLLLRFKAYEILLYFLPNLRNSSRRGWPGVKHPREKGEVVVWLTPP